jgi:murein hydrolase activator
MPGRSGRYLILVAVVAMVPVLTSGHLLATLSPSEGTLGDLEAAREQLLEVREVLTRRESFRRGLETQTETLGAELALLRRQRAAVDGRLRAAQDEKRHIERELDRLAPRLAARNETVDRHRTQAARVLADLAGLSRHVEIDPTIRARLLAVSPLMLERLQNAQVSLSRLDREREQVAARHGELQRELPLLRARREQLEREHAQLERQRVVLAERRTQLEAEFQTLGQEHERLARQVLIGESALALRAEPQADAPALVWAPPAASEPAAGPAPAALKGHIDRDGVLARAVEGLDGRPARVVAATVDPIQDLEPTLSVEAERPILMPPPAKPAAQVATADVDHVPVPGWASLSRTATADISAVDLRSILGADSRLVPARLDRPDAPILPVPGEIVGRFGDLSDGVGAPSLPIRARAGQAVAAPDAGRVAWAGDFKSYGLLLIIEHQREYHTLLWGMSRLDVADGDIVRAGQVVGVMGPGEEGTVLHLEVRRNGRPVNPLPWLAASSSKVRG